MATNVKYNVPEGADPLGIGVVDLGKSTYDPIAIVRRGFATARQDRLINRQERRREYEQFKSNLPTFEAVNQKIAGSLNKKVVEMGELAYQKYKSGIFSPFAKTKEGRGTELELAKREKEVATLGPAYNALLPEIKNAITAANDVRNRDILDQELTLEQINKVRNVDDLESMSRAVGEGLLVYKVQPVGFQKWKKDNIKEYIPEETVEIVSETVGPKTGKLRVETVKYKDPKEAARGMRRMYNDAPPEMKKYIQAEYEKAPVTQKVNKDGIKVAVEDWYAMEHVPSYGREQGVKYYAGVSKAEKEGAKVSRISTPEKVDGVYAFDDWKNTQTFGTAAGAEKVSTIDIPVMQFDTPFVMPNVPGTIDNSTGEAADHSKIVSELPSSVSFAPVATETFDMQLEGGDQRTFKKGDIIPKEYRDEMMLNKNYEHLKKSVHHEAFLMSLSSYKQVPGDIPEKYKDNPLAKKAFEATSSYTKTTRRPYKAVAKWLEDRSKKEKIDFSEFTGEVDAMLSQLNSLDHLYQETGKVKTIDDIWRTAHE